MHGVDTGPLPVDLWTAIGIVLFCVALSAFFAGSETALTAASRARMHALERSGNSRARTVNRLLKRRDRLIGATLLGATLVNIGSSAFTTNVLVDIFGDHGVLYATGVMTVLLLVFAEVMPKTVAINYPDQWSLLVAKIMAFFVAIFGPILVGVEYVVVRMPRSIGTRCGVKITSVGLPPKSDSTWSISGMWRCVPTP